MTCHNGSQTNDYSGPGLENPHPYGSGGSAKIKCTTCHGGNPNGENPPDAHVPPPPEIGDDAFQTVDDFAYFNRHIVVGAGRRFAPARVIATH